MAVFLLKKLIHIINEYLHMAMHENTLVDICPPVADARVLLTPVSSTKIPPLWLKYPVLVVKMLKIRKNRPRMALFWILSSKIAVKYLTYEKKRV
jgi:hypothetical protein